MTELAHFLASPFPTVQGTQAAVGAMLRAEAEAGRRARLFAYPERFGDDPIGVRVERTPRMGPSVGARSGPSLARVAHDARAIPWLVARRSAPLLAHNVEAACVARAARARFAFVAHTSFERELATYDGMPARAGVVGAFLDRTAIGGARACAAIAPRLAAMLEARWSCDVSYLPIPWRLGRVTDATERMRLRAARGIDADEIVVLHAGNLDGYQGLETVAEAVRALGATRRVRWLVATTSELARPYPAFSGVHVDAAALATEHDRHEAHAVADVALLSRRAEGGLPIKLLEAFARGLPVVATETSLAGLPVGDAVLRSASSDPRDLADLVATIANARDARRADLAERGRRYLAEHHSDAAYLDARDRLAIAISARSRTVRR